MNYSCLRVEIVIMHMSYGHWACVPEINTHAPVNVANTRIQTRTCTHVHTSTHKQQTVHGTLHTQIATCDRLSKYSVECHFVSPATSVGLFHHDVTLHPRYLQTTHPMQQSEQWEALLAYLSASCWRLD